MERTYKLSVYVTVTDEEARHPENEDSVCEVAVEMAIKKVEKEGGKDGVVETDGAIIYNSTPSAPNVRRFLDISTSHLPRELGTGGILREDGVTAYELTYGFLLYVPDDEAGGDWVDTPTEVQAIIDRARSLGCDYVLIDRDGPVDSQLPTWDWRRTRSAQEPDTMSNRMTYHYLLCALWSSTTGEDGETPLDDLFCVETVPSEVWDWAAADCAAFLAKCATLGINLEADGHDEAQLGHDFWLTRNGHGAGFWDGDWPVSGEALTTLAKAFHEAWLDVDDAGNLYAG